MVAPLSGEFAVDVEPAVSRSMTCSRTLRSRIRNTTGEPLTSNRSVLLPLPLLLTGDVRETSNDVSAVTVTDFSLTDGDVGGNSDTRNCDTLQTHRQTYAYRHRDICDKEHTHIQHQHTYTDKYRHKCTDTRQKNIRQDTFTDITSRHTDSDRQTDNDRQT